MTGQKESILADTKRACVATVVALIVGVFVQYGYFHDWHFTKEGQERAAMEKLAAEKRVAAAAEARERQHQIAEVEAVVAASLKDPDSAQFRDIYIGALHACGQVNARNGFDGYSGFTDFYVVGTALLVVDPSQFRSTARAYIRDPEMTDSVWGHVLPDECLNHWADQRGMDWLKRVRGL